MRGNNVMSGYFSDQAATGKAFAGGWFHSGDLAVWHPDGNIELRDRGKDIIISGGENISSIEVEQAICRPSRGARMRGHRDPAPALGRAAQGVRHAQRGRRGDRGGDHRVLPRAPRPLQVPRRRSSSGRCRRPPPARSRSSCCATANGQGRTSGSAGHSARNLSPALMPASPDLATACACSALHGQMRAQLGQAPPNDHPGISRMVVRANHQNAPERRARRACSAVDRRLVAERHRRVGPAPGDTPGASGLRQRRGQPSRSSQGRPMRRAATVMLANVQNIRSGAP